MTKFLFVFIDGFPYSFLEATNFLNNGFATRVPLTPGLGYSVNIHAEMFLGAQPDKMGYLNAWTYKSMSEKPRLLRWFRFLFDETGRLPLGLVDWKMHSLLDRVGFTVGNIPFPYRHLFTRCDRGKHITNPEFLDVSVFGSIPNMEFCISESVPRRAGLRDEVSFEQARRAVRQGRSVFATFVDLDSISHKYGVGSEEHLGRIRQLDHWVEELSNAFLNHRGNAESIFVFSDHGMANVEETVKLIPERSLGDPSHCGYTYFTDSTMLRLWVTDEAFRPTLENYAHDLTDGHLLSHEERLNYGVQSLRFGDYVFILDAGKVYNPSFVSRGVPAAMHGYHPSLESQQGIFLFNGAPLQSASGFGTVDLFSTLEDVIAKG